MKQASERFPKDYCLRFLARKCLCSRILSHKQEAPLRGAQDAVCDSFIFHPFLTPAIIWLLQPSRCSSPVVGARLFPNPDGNNCTTFVFDLRDNNKQQACSQQPLFSVIAMEVSFCDYKMQLGRHKIHGYRLWRLSDALERIHALRLLTVILTQILSLIHHSWQKDISTPQPVTLMPFCLPVS